MYFATTVVESRATFVSRSAAMPKRRLLIVSCLAIPVPVRGVGLAFRSPMRVGGDRRWQAAGISPPESVGLIGAATLLSVMFAVTFILVGVWFRATWTRKGVWLGGALFVVRTFPLLLLDPRIRAIVNPY